MDRRRFLLSAASAGSLAAVWPLLGRPSHDEALAQALPLGVVFDPAPFTLGVASGDPLADSVILWTRLAPLPLLLDPTASQPLAERVEVDWVIAADPRLRRVVASGTAIADAGRGHSVHVDVGGLDPRTTYWYRFAALGRVSRIGRTRTAPAPGSLEPVRFGVVSCQSFPSGHWAAYRGLAHEDLDLVVHLGDYIYEGRGDGEGRAHVGPETTLPVDYRARHALYKGDPALRAAHAAFPWIVTWDDHEVDNNYAGLTPQDADAAQGNDTPERFAMRRAVAYATYYEHLPIRLGPAGTGTAGPGHPAPQDFRIYRRYAYGDLLDVSVIDTRQYRTDQPCDDREAAAFCSGVDDPDATILGTEQRDWLLGGLSSSTAAWRLIANQVMVAQLKAGGLPDLVDDPVTDLQLLPITDGDYLNADQWDGYQADRRRLLEHLATEEVPDVVVITGDIHTSWVADLRVDFDNPVDGIVATEFVGTSISSGGFPEGTNPAIRASLAASNPHFRFYEGEQRGYVVCDVTPERWRSEYRAVADSGDPRSPVSRLAAFEVPRGGLVTQVEGGDGQPPRLPPGG